MAMMGSLRATLATATAWATTDFRAEMPGIAVPVLVVHGTGDETVPIAISGERSAALLPHATLLAYEGEPHGLILTAGDRLNQDLLGFILGTREPLPAANPA
jgi:pimeloyl-ACP methyl ester carboxylesterase